MNIPGFTAEVSLLQASNRYPMNFEVAYTDGVVHPALSDWIGSRACWAYRCTWIDVSPGIPFPPRMVRRCGFKWIC